jgi:anhydro-N-acetylmuramic acid kinase
MQSSPSADSLYIGLMSGTSLDGVDAVLADFSSGAPRMLGTHYRPYPDDLRKAILAIHEPGDNELHRGAVLANAITREYAQAVSVLLSANGNPAIAAIGCHGQTIRHRPDEGYTVQLVNGALLAELTGLTAVTDFRSRDIAAGGEGAPLVPAFHAACFRVAGKSRVIVNIGGIANVTYLPNEGPISGFDTGPGNLLMDAWANRHLGQTYDANGAVAASGKVQAELLAAMLSDAYFHRAPPKSTGRDYFNIAWLERQSIAGIAPRDCQATLAELSAVSISAAITNFCSDANEVYVCGGGAQNGHLMRRLTALLPNRSLATTEALGMHPDWVEALAFAWLARCTIHNMPGNAPEVTGAKGSRVLGALYPK